LTTGRVLHVRPQAAHEALQARRDEQQTPEFPQEYARRAGIEGTLSQAVRGMGIRRARYDGLPKVQLQHVLTAVGINLVRIDAVLTQTLVARHVALTSHAWQGILLYQARPLHELETIHNVIRQQSPERAAPLLWL